MSYEVIITGLNPDWKEDVARSKLAGLLKTTQVNIEKIISSGSYAVKKDVPEHLAQKYKSAIEGCGGICELKSSSNNSIDLNSPAFTSICFNSNNDSAYTPPLARRQDLKDLDIHNSDEDSANAISGNIPRTSTLISILKFVVFILVVGALGVGYNEVKHHFFDSGASSNISAETESIAYNEDSCLDAGNKTNLSLCALNAFGYNSDNEEYRKFVFPLIKSNSYSGSSKLLVVNV